jgi:hypothetical protein
MKNHMITGSDMDFRVAMLMGRLDDQVGGIEAVLQKDFMVF